MSSVEENDKINPILTADVIVHGAVKTLLEEYFRSRRLSRDQAFTLRRKSQTGDLDSLGWELVHAWLRANPAVVFNIKSGGADYRICLRPMGNEILVSHL